MHFRAPLKTLLFLSFGEELKVRQNQQNEFLDVPFIQDLIIIQQNEKNYLLFPFYTDCRFYFHM